jgi:hypothetical protein
MPTDVNLFKDLLKIAEGDVEVASDRVRQFESFANDVASQGWTVEPTPIQIAQVAVRPRFADWFRS